MPDVKPMKVEYKPHTDCEKREPLAPEGWEIVRNINGEITPPGKDSSGAAVETRAEVDGYWKVVETFHGTPIGALLIRPIAKPFKLSGPGWYKDALGAWQNLTSCMYWYHSGDEWVYSCCETKIHYNSDGSNKSPRRGADLIARATDAQAKILDAL